MTHRIEDVIDTFLVEIEENRPKTIFQVRIDLGIKDLGAGSEENGQHQLSFDFDDSQVVGLEVDKHKIINRLLDRSISRRMVLSIVGTGGLAQKIYKSVQLEGQFNCLAWLSISQKFNLNDLFREILYSIEPEMRKQNQPLTDDDIPVKIKSTLRDKRFSIILDDVWTTDLWKQLKIAIPDPPLALVVLGGILSRRKRNYTAWRTMEETMDWHDEDGKKCSQVLAMSYENLPYELKPCFLYFASFPEDYNISGQHVTRMWMAEGLVPKDGVGTIEDRTEKCLEELVQRCLIQVTKKSWNVYCKYCSMHDLLRDIAIRKAKDENFFTVFSKQDVNNLAASEPRCVALQFCTPTEDGIYSENTRSLLCFGFGRSSYDNSGFELLNYSGFRLLRVLTLESVDMATFTRRQWLKGLLHLRYLGSRGCVIPQDIFKNFSFYNLETIDFNGSKIVDGRETLDLCDVVIPTLRHVYGSFRFRLPLKWDKHTNLQTIMNVEIHIESVVELGFCINLRTLVIGIDDDLDNGKAIKEWQNLKRVLKRTEQLVYLSIGTFELLPFGGTKDLHCHGKIQKLVLEGYWERNICVPSVEMFPTNLTTLKLVCSGLQEDPMPILERLQSLRILYFYYNSYVGREFICSTGGFSNLEKLKLIKLLRLRHWDIKEGAMPILRHLEIGDCKKLHVLPELQKVRTHQELTICRPSHEVWQGMQMQGKDQHKIKHIPSVRIRELSSSLQRLQKEMQEEDIIKEMNGQI